MGSAVVPAQEGCCWTNWRNLQTTHRGKATCSRALGTEQIFNTSQGAFAVLNWYHFELHLARQKRELFCPDG